MWNERGRAVGLRERAVPYRELDYDWDAVSNRGWSSWGYKDSYPTRDVLTGDVWQRRPERDLVPHYTSEKRVRHY